MVLDEATSAQDPPFSESSPSSDADPYASDFSSSISRDPFVISINPPGTPQVYVNLHDVQRTWNRSKGVAWANTLQRACHATQKAVNRPLRQDEAEAVVGNWAKAIDIGTLGMPVGATFGAVQAWRKRQTYRFPFRNPGANFNPDLLGPLKGSAARAGWHALRGATYGILGVFFAQFFFAQYSMSVLAYNTRSDPRLKDIREALEARSKTRREQLPQRGADESPAPQQGETFEMARQRRSAQEAWRKNRGSQSQSQSQSERGTQADDMSPTGGAFGQEYVDMGTESGVLSDDQMRQFQDRSRTDREERRTEPTSSTSRARRPDPQTQQNNDPFAPSVSESTPKPSSSAWERLRQQATSDGQVPTSGRGISSPRTAPARASQDSRQGDSFSFSQGDEDRQLARAEAQKDFDARVEREREGKDFEDRGRRW